MATAIKETPVLKGEADRRFLRIIRENEVHPANEYF